MVWQGGHARRLYRVCLRSAEIARGARSVALEWDSRAGNLVLATTNGNFDRAEVSARGTL
jgi:hypothetical protein